MDELTGSVERITYYNPENGYSVLRLRPETSQRAPSQSLSRDPGRTGAGGLRHRRRQPAGADPRRTPAHFDRVSTSSTYQLSTSQRGRWDNHPQHGQQFKAEFCEQTLPASAAGIESYLGSGLESAIVFLVGLNSLFEKEHSLRLSDEEREQLMLENTRKVYMAATRAGQCLVFTYVGPLPDVLKGLLVRNVG